MSSLEHKKRVISNLVESKGNFCKRNMLRYYPTFKSVHSLRNSQFYEFIEIVKQAKIYVKNGLPFSTA